MDMIDKFPDIWCGERFTAGEVEAFDLGTFHDVADYFFPVLQREIALFKAGMAKLAAEITGIGKVEIDNQSGVKLAVFHRHDPFV